MNLPPDWFSIVDDDVGRFEKELAREVCPEHILSGVTAKCIARRYDRDDFLFRVGLEDHEYAVVHLTWSKETSPDCPWVKPFKDFEEFAADSKSFG